MKRLLGQSLTIAKLSMMASATVLINLSLGQPGSTATLYNLTDLGALTNSGASYATGINNNGQVVGQSAAADGFRAFLWNSTGGMINLGTLPGGSYSYATGINDNGQVVGYASVNNTPLAFQWNSKSGITGLEAVPNSLRSYAYGINNSGQIAGNSDLGSDVSIATQWNSNNTGIELGTRGISSIGTGINDRGQVVGQTTSSDGFRATLWNPTAGMTNLGTLNGGDYSYATGINEKGQVVGYSAIADTSSPSASTSATRGLLGKGIKAFLWNSDQGLTNLGSLSPEDNSYATGINETGQVVGYSYGLRNGDYLYRAFLWDNGVMRDLNSLIDPAAGWALRVANAVNDQGQIVGFGINSTGQYRAFLLTPNAPLPMPIPLPIPIATHPSDPVPANSQSVPESSAIWGLAFIGLTCLRQWQRSLKTL